MDIYFFWGGGGGGGGFTFKSTISWVFKRTIHFCAFKKLLQSFIILIHIMLNSIFKK